MSTLLNRRKWLRNTALATGALTLVGRTSAWSAVRSSKSSLNASKTFWEWETSYSSATRPPVKARLLANENPYGPSPMARKAIIDAVTVGNRYGHEDAATLTKMIAEKEDVPEE